MLIIPAIDLKRGKCVRLWQGIREKETIYAEDPLQVARLWVKRGAKRLHIVDLDGAFSGVPHHLGVAENIKKSLSVRVQYGGGIRRLEVLREIMQKDIDFAIVGTRALSKNFVKGAVNRFGGRVIISIDCKKDKVALKGWEKEITVDIKELVKNLTEMGTKTIILTDITRDGTLKGINLDFIQFFSKNVSCDLIIAGGISSVEDIKRINEMGNERIKGVIIGKALYTGAINLEEALRLSGKG